MSDVIDEKSAEARRNSGILNSVCHARTESNPTVKYGWILNPACVSTETAITLDCSRKSKRRNVTSVHSRLQHKFGVAVPLWASGICQSKNFRRPRQISQSFSSLCLRHCTGCGLLVRSTINANFVSFGHSVLSFAGSALSRLDFCQLCITHLMPHIRPTDVKSFQICIRFLPLCTFLIEDSRSINLNQCLDYARRSARGEPT